MCVRRFCESICVWFVAIGIGAKRSTKKGNLGAPPTNQHRIELLEQGLGKMRSNIVDQIAIAIKTAAQDMLKS